MVRKNKAIDFGKIIKKVKKFFNIKMMIKKTLVFMIFFIAGLTLILLGVSEYIGNALEISKEFALIITGIAAIIIGAIYKKL